MADAFKEQLINSLTQSFINMQSTLKGIDLDLIIYEESSWQVRDILWHLAVWDRQVTKSIHAFIEDGEYAISNFDEDEFNQKSYLEGQRLTVNQILEEYDQARKGFKDAVQDFPTEKYSSEFLYPWGDENGDITTLVNDMVEHDEEHREEIKSAIG